MASHRPRSVQWAIEQARQRCPRAAFVTGLLEDQHFAPASFDVITLWDVLEHVHSPREAVQQVSEWLTPQGWLFLNVPDAHSWVARLLGRRWVLLLREHCGIFRTIPWPPCCHNRASNWFTPVRTGCIFR